MLLSPLWLAVGPGETQRPTDQKWIILLLAVLGLLLRMWGLLKILAEAPPAWDVLASAQQFLQQESGSVAEETSDWGFEMQITRSYGESRHLSVAGVMENPGHFDSFSDVSQILELWHNGNSFQIHKATVPIPAFEGLMILAAVRLAANRKTAFPISPPLFHLVLYYCRWLWTKVLIQHSCSVFLLSLYGLSACPGQTLRGVYIHF